MLVVTQWPRGLRRGSVAAHLLAWRVRITPGTWMSLVSGVCCQVEVCASGWSFVQRSPADCDVSECDREASIMRKPWPTRGCRAIKKLRKILLKVIFTSYGRLLKCTLACVREYVRCPAQDGISEITHLLTQKKNLNYHFQCRMSVSAINNHGGQWSMWTYKERAWKMTNVQRTKVTHEKTVCTVVLRNLITDFLLALITSYFHTRLYISKKLKLYGERNHCFSSSDSRSGKIADGFPRALSARHCTV